MTDPDVDQASRAQVELWSWHAAVRHQAERLREDGRQANSVAAIYDHHFLLIAARNLLRAADWMGECGVPIADALAAFEASVPNVKDMRDALEHFDERLVGRIPKGRAPIRGVLITTFLDDGPPAAHFEGDIGLRPTAIEAAAAALRTEADRALALLARQGSSRPSSASGGESPPPAGP